MIRLIFLILLLFNFAFAEETKPYVSPTLEMPILKNDSYEDELLLLLKNNSENFHKLDFYKNVKIKINGEIKNIEQLDKTRKNLFLIYRGESLSDTMLFLQNMLSTQIEKSNNNIEKTKCIKRAEMLFQIRKNHAIILEKETERLLSELEEISQQEKDDYIKKIKSWNLANNLTELE